MTDGITDTERTRNFLVDVLGKNLPSSMFVMAEPNHGGKLVFADNQGHFWLVTVETARVAVNQGPG